MDNIKQIIGSARYKLAPDEDFNYKIHLESTSSGLKNNLNKIISDFSAEQLFTDERNDSTKYRILGRLNLITDNSIFYTVTTTSPGGVPQITTYPSNTEWDFLFYVDPVNGIQPKNWVLQILYPSKIDKYTNVGTNQAYKGISINSLTSVNPSGSKNQVLLNTEQKNKLSFGDICYVYSNTHFSNYTGFHTVEYLGVDGNFLENNIRLTTEYIGPANGNKLTLKRVINVSDDDINFVDPKQILSATPTDISGNTTVSLTNANYTTIKTGNLTPAFSASTHNLRKSDYVEIRCPNGPGLLNGLYRVEHIIDRYNFVIDLRTGLTPGTNIPLGVIKPLFRRLDGIPSDYYIRKFTLLTSNEYDVNKATSFGNSIYPKVNINKLGVANDTWLFTFTNDINTVGLYSHKGGNLTELYLGIIKKSGKNSIDWSDVTAHWDFQYLVANTANGLETISENNPLGGGSIEKNIPNSSEYFGDFVEYNRGEITEKIVSKIVHRFALNNNNTPQKGYYYDPFQRIYIRKFSNIIETAFTDDNVIGIPGDAELRPNKSYEWKDILEPGYIEEGNNGVDYPFLNGANYIFLNKYVYLRRQIPDVPIPVTNNTNSQKISLIC
jgi:hypothetical protein